MRGGSSARERPEFARPTAKTVAVSAAGIAFVGMAVSGLVLYARPRTAFGSQLVYSFLGIDASGWIRVHVVFALLFLLAGVWHILLHIGVIRAIFVSAPGHHRGHWPEALAIFGVAIFFLVTAAVDVPPSSWITDLKYELGRAFGHP